MDRGSPRRRFLHPYYVLNGLLIVSYITLRTQRLSEKQTALQLIDMFGVSRESQIYFSLTLLLFTRLLSAPTVDAYLSSLFSFTRITILLCLWYLDTPLLLLFTTLWLILYATCPQPRYSLPQSLNIVTLNPPSFHSRITTNTHQTIHIVWCHAPWSPRCSQLTPVLAGLALQFKHPRIVFCRVDVSKFGQIADVIGNLSTQPTSKQLPCIIAYKQGKEFGRIPVCDNKHRVPKQFVHGFTKTDVSNALDLKSLYDTAVKWELDAQKRYKEKRTN